MTSTFIKAAEVWLPTQDGSLLEFGGGAFGPARRFAALSRTMCFGRGEGLPGQAWELGQPVLLRQFEKTNFRRTDAARSAGFTCAIAIPFAKRGPPGAVLVLFCGHDPVQASALELWHLAAHAHSGLTLADGAYGVNAQAFEAISRDTHLPRGGGLPGVAWERGEAVFMEDLAAVSGGFVRAEPAAQAGMVRGLAIPVGSATESSHVVGFLASRTLPLAQRIERWVPDVAKTMLHRAYAFSELHGGHSTVSAELPLSQPPSGPVSSIAKAWTAGVAVVNDEPSAEAGAPAAAASSIGSMGLVAIPVVRGATVTEVVALYL